MTKKLYKPKNPINTNIEIGKKFNRLTIISKGNNVLAGIKTKQWIPTWNCQCDCGTFKNVKNVDIVRNRVKSCGCLTKQYGKTFKTGSKIWRLTCISYGEGFWFCICDCGKYVNAKSSTLTCGNTKSCGCLSAKMASERSVKLIASRTKYHPSEYSARKTHGTYKYMDKKSDVSFEDFMDLSQRNCFYCDIKPYRKTNVFKSGKKASQNAKENGHFTYNGLDRVDNSIHHTTSNVVTACLECNRAKNKKSMNDFLTRILHMDKKEFSPILNVINYPIPYIKHLKSSISQVYYKIKNDTDLTLEEFYSISQLNCFYCNLPPSNNFNNARNIKNASKDALNKGNYIYNGIDRIDSSLDHRKSNIVPCCYYCNFAKSDMTLQDFYAWVTRIQIFQNRLQKSIFA